MKYARLYAAMLDEIWVIQRDKLEAMFGVLDSREAGIDLVAFGRGRDDGPAEPQQFGSSRVIHVGGVLSPYIGSMQESSGGVSAERLGGWVDEAMRDPKTESIVLNLRSPGGAVAGIPELAAKIRAAREVKPVYASINHMAASGGYWLASQASEISITPSGSAANIGVISVREWDDEEEGRKRVVVSAGDRKTQASGFEPPDDATIARMQDRVNAIYAQFVGDVAAGRRVTAEKVMADFGQGELLSATECINCGAADRIETLEQVLARISVKPPYARMKARASL